MTINVKHISTGTYRLVDGEFVCNHDNVMLDPPCCVPGTQDCGCKGMWGVYCPDCKDMTDAQREIILERIF